MSGLETLSPDQRAVLQLILVQGRGYDELATTLRLDAAAVRERAHAGAAALVPEQLDAATRGRVVDYLLGQQDDGERIVTFAELGDSPDACRWAQALRERLAGVARDELPELPTGAVPVSANGASAVATVPERPAADPAMPDPATATAAIAAIPPAPPPAPSDDAPPREPSGARPSRLGGAILIAGVAALVIVLAIVLIGGNGDDNNGSSGASTNAPQTSAQTQTTTTGSARAQARPIGAAVLRPSAGSALGAALIQKYAGGRRLMAVEAARMPGNSGSDYYGIWLQGSAGNRFLGFVPNQVRASGSFTVSSPLPRDLNLASYTTVLVTTEGSSAVPTTPGATVLSGPLRLAG